jgi:hypothetical protein
MLTNMQDDTILIGDINMPGIDWTVEKSDAKGCLLLETTIECNLKQLVSFPTHIQGSILNLVIVNNPEHVLDINDVERPGRSDHCMFELLVTGGAYHDQQSEEGYNWHRADMKKMRERMENVVWRNELNRDTVQESWTRFKELPSNIMESTVPKKRQNRRARQPWMTAKITRQMRRKRSWNTLKKHNTAENREKYNEVEKKTRNMIRNAKRKLEKNLANGPDKNNKFARYIKLKTKSQMHHWTSAIS